MSRYHLTPRGLARQGSDEMGQFLFRFGVPELHVRGVCYEFEAVTIEKVKQDFIHNAALCKEDVLTNDLCNKERMALTAVTHMLIGMHIETFAQQALAQKLIVESRD